MYLLVKKEIICKKILCCKLHLTGAETFNGCVCCEVAMSLPPDEPSLDTVSSTRDAAVQSFLCSSHAATLARNARISRPFARSSALSSSMRDDFFLRGERTLPSDARSLTDSPAVALRGGDTFMPVVVVVAAVVDDDAAAAAAVDAASCVCFERFDDDGSLLYEFLGDDIGLLPSTAITTRFGDDFGTDEDVVAIADDDDEDVAIETVRDGDDESFSRSETTAPISVVDGVRLTSALALSELFFG